MLLAPVLTAGLAGVGVPIVLAIAMAIIIAGGATVFAVWMRHGVDWILDVLIAGPRILLLVVLAGAIAACVTNGRSRACWSARAPIDQGALPAHFQRQFRRNSGWKSLA